MSFATLRSTNFGTDEEGNPIDPIALVQDNPEGGVRVLDYEEFDDEDARGIRIRISVQTADDDVIIDQTVLVDSGTSRRYVLSFGCSGLLGRARGRVRGGDRVVDGGARS